MIRAKQLIEFIESGASSGSDEYDDCETRTFDIDIMCTDCVFNDTVACAYTRCRANERSDCRNVYFVWKTSAPEISVVKATANFPCDDMGAPID